MPIRRRADRGARRERAGGDRTAVDGNRRERGDRHRRACRRRVAEPNRRPRRIGQHRPLHAKRQTVHQIEFGAMDRQPRHARPRRAQRGDLVGRVAELERTRHFPRKRAGCDETVRLDHVREVGGSGAGRRRGRRSRRQHHMSVVRTRGRDRAGRDGAAVDADRGKRRRRRRAGRWCITEPHGGTGLGGSDHVAHHEGQATDEIEIAATDRHRSERVHSVAGRSHMDRSAGGHAQLVGRRRAEHDEVRDWLGDVAAGG